MGMFDHFPYTNFHELNLDWILQALKEIERTMNEFVAINSLKFADPIQWNIVKQYEKNTIVIDPLTGTAYISVHAVPSGVALTNTDYWTVVFDLRSFVVRAAKNFTLRWEEATTLTATFPTDEGDWLIWGDTLYRALSNIIAGDQYVIDSNIKRITVEEIKDEIYQTFNNIIGSLDNLDTTDKTNLVAAINEIVAIIGSLDDLDTTDKTNIVAAINEIVAGLTEEVEARTNADNSINEKINNMRVYNVRDYGAVGDGVADDTDAIKNTFNAAVDGVVYVPDGTYLISDTIVLSTSIYFESLNAIFKANANVNLVELKPNCDLHGGKFDISFAQFTKAAIYLDGHSQFGLTESPFNCIAENFLIIGNYKGIGIELYAPAGTGGGGQETMSFIEHVHFSKFNVIMTDIGIKISKENAATNWVNGNNFVDFLLEGMRLAISIGSGCDGNVFNDFQYQPYANGHSIWFANVAGNLNIFKGFIWDWYFEGQYEAIIVSGNYNLFETNLYLYRNEIFSDSGICNHFLPNVKTDHNNIISPHGEGAYQFAGDQDDCLFRADLYGSVTATPAPSGGNISAMFSRANQCQFSGTVSIIIDLTAKPIISLERIGFEFSKAPKIITVEGFYDGQYHTLINTANGDLLRDFYFKSRPANLTYLRISFNSNTAIWVNRIYASDANRPSNVYVTQYGTTYKGSITFEDPNSSLILKDSDGNAHKVFVSTSGNLYTNPW